EVGRDAERHRQAVPYDDVGTHEAEWPPETNDLPGSVPRDHRRLFGQARKELVAQVGVTREVGQEVGQKGQARCLSGGPLRILRRASRTTKGPLSRAALGACADDLL